MKNMYNNYSADIIDAVVYGMGNKRSLKVSGEDFDSDGEVVKNYITENKYSIDPSNVSIDTPRKPVRSFNDSTNGYYFDESNVLSKIEHGFNKREGRYSPFFLNKMGAYLKEKIVPSLEELADAKNPTMKRIALNKFHNCLNEFLKHAGNVEPVALFVGKLANVVSKFISDTESVDLKKVILVCNKYLSNLANDSTKLYNDLTAIIPASFPAADVELFEEEEFAV